MPSSTSYESAMDMAGRHSSHAFSDLRSASRAQNRVRDHKRKYYNFMGDLTPGQLPSSSFQQSHRVPSCSHGSKSRYGPLCITAGVPADLSAGPIAKFTKREAWQNAWYGTHVAPPRHHSDALKDFPNWEKQRGRKREVMREIRDKEYLYELEYTKLMQEVLEEYYLCQTFADWVCVLNESGDYYQQYYCDPPWGEDIDEYEGEDEGYGSDHDNNEELCDDGYALRPRGQGPVVWHVNYQGVRFWGMWECAPGQCFCDWYDVEREYEKDVWFKDVDLNSLVQRKSKRAETGGDKEAWMGTVSEDDWDIISDTSSQWTEVDLMGIDT